MITLLVPFLICWANRKLARSSWMSSHMCGTCIKNQNNGRYSTSDNTKFPLDDAWTIFGKLFSGLTVMLGKQHANGDTNNQQILRAISRWWLQFHAIGQSGSVFSFHSDLLIHLIIRKEALNAHKNSRWRSRSTETACWSSVFFQNKFSVESVHLICKDQCKTI